ncbi:hypothetical protein PtB15_4B750 [Puccinia triticina]|nr:hypothetical protein PtB15_4B750 [Puccinia triticina]
MHVGGTERGPADGHPCSREASVRPPTASASPPTTGGSDIPPAAEGTSGPLAYPFLHGPPAPRPPFPLPHRASPASLDTGLRPAHHSFPDLLLPATLHPGLATLPSQGPLRHANPLFDARLAPPPALSLPARAPGLPGPQIHARPPRPGGAEDPPPPPSPRPASPPPDPRLSLLPSPLPHLHPGPANMLHLAHFHA